MTRSFLAALFMTAAMATPAGAEIYKIEPSHTRVQYRVSHLGFSQMPGIFSDVRGTIDFDPEKPNTAQVEAIINANAVTMNNSLLDSKLKGGDFFNTAKFPVITFKSTEIERTGASKGVMHGQLTLLGVTRPVVLKIDFRKKGWNKYQGGDAVGFSAWTKIHRSDFGMKYLLPDVGDDVSIRIDLEAVKLKPGEVLDKAAEVKVIDTTKDKPVEAKKPSSVEEEDDETANAPSAKPKADQPPVAQPPATSPPVTAPPGKKRPMSAL